jgi:hypothetical protein
MNPAGGTYLAVFAAMEKKCSHIGSKSFIYLFLLSTLKIFLNFPLLCGKVVRIRIREENYCIHGSDRDPEH